jgi:hypothetical protein
MANANLAQRTFSKLITIPALGSLTVSCVDSGGNLLKCNYLATQFDCSTNAPSAGVLFVSPQVGSLTVHPSSIGTSLSSTAATSGALGFALASDGIVVSPIYEYICLGNENFSLINLYNIGSIGGYATLTYGIVQEFNTLRAGDNKLYTKGS